jgi:hypothetical protein
LLGETATAGNDGVDALAGSAKRRLSESVGTETAPSLTRAIGVEACGATPHGGGVLVTAADEDAPDAGAFQANVPPEDDRAVTFAVNGPPAAVPAPLCITGKGSP